MKHTYVLLAVIAILLILLILDFKQKKYDAPSSEPILRKRIEILELELTKSARERITRDRYNDSLNHVNNSLIRMNSQYDSILTKVKGSYNNVNPTELGQEMIRRYNSAR